MKFIPFDFNGRTYRLSCTAEALFMAYDRYGVVDDLLEASGCLQPTAAGWRECCWLAACFAAQGELQRRVVGYDREPLLTVEELRTGLMAAQAPALQRAVRDALAQGFHREIPDPEPEEEVNLVLREREEAEKKTKALALSVLDFLQSALPSSDSAPPTP